MKGIINNQEVSMFIDSGAMRTVVNPKFIKVLEEQYVLDKEIPIAGGLSKEITFARVAEIPIEIDKDLSIVQEVVVTDKLQTAMVLGADILKEHEVRVQFSHDIAKQSIQFGNSNRQGNTNPLFMGAILESELVMDSASTESNSIKMTKSDKASSGINEDIPLKVAKDSLIPPQ
jgi:hypothetical protein